MGRCFGVRFTTERRRSATHRVSRAAGYQMDFRSSKAPKTELANCHHLLQPFHMRTCFSSILPSCPASQLQALTLLYVAVSCFTRQLSLEENLEPRQDDLQGPSAALALEIKKKKKVVIALFWGISFLPYGLNYYIKEVVHVICVNKQRWGSLIQ